MPLDAVDAVDAVEPVDTVEPVDAEKNNRKNPVQTIPSARRF